MSDKPKYRALLAVLAIAYLIGAAVTYGYAYRQAFEFQMSLPNRSPLGRDMWLVNHFATGDGLMCALFWPIYVPCHVSRIMWAKGNP